MGKVSIPIGLYLSAKHVDDVAFKTLHEKCGTPISFGARRCDTCDIELVADDENSATVSGFEISEGQYVRISKEDIASVLVGDRLELDRFLDTCRIDPTMIDTTYLVGPGKDPAAAHAYDALLKALRKTELAGVGRIGMGQRERVAAVWPVRVEGAGTLIGLSTLYAVDGIRMLDAAAIHDRIDALGTLAANSQEVDLFADLMRQKLVGTAFRWRAIKRYYPSKLAELVEAKRAGGEVVIAPQVADVAPLDLVAALNKSLRKQRVKA